MTKVFSVELVQYHQGSLYNREYYNIKESTAERAIIKAKTLAKADGIFFKTKPIEVEALKVVVSDLR